MGEVVNLVMGAFGEASKDVLHYLVQKVQESRAVAVGLRSYKVESEVENGMFVSQILRSLSTNCVTAQVQCLLY